MEICISGSHLTLELGFIRKQTFSYFHHFIGNMLQSCFIFLYHTLFLHHIALGNRLIFNHLPEHSFHTVIINKPTEQAHCGM